MPGQIQDIQTPDGRIQIELRGSGPTLLCLHGISANRRSWSAVADRLERQFRLVLVDLLSRGRSEARPDVPYRMGDEIHRVRQVLDALALSPTIVAGHSQGAALALALASVDERVTGLVLLNPVTSSTRRPRLLALLRSGLIRRAAAGIIRPLRSPLAHLTLRRVYGPRIRVTRERVAAYAEPYGDRLRVRALLRLLADWRPEELEEWMPASAPLACVVAGGRDPRVEPASARRLAQRLGAEFLLVDPRRYPGMSPARSIGFIERSHRAHESGKRSQTR